MKKIVLLLLIAAVASAAIFFSCSKESIYEQAYLIDINTSGCNHYTDSIAAKEIKNDSVVVTFEDGILTVLHHNMMLDCGSGDNIVTSLVQTGDTITVTEYVGEQGITNCICAYDNSFSIVGFSRPFFLRVVLEYDFLGTPDSLIVYEHSFR